MPSSESDSRAPLETPSADDANAQFGAQMVTASPLGFPGPLGAVGADAECQVLRRPCAARQRFSS
jgi:hypothetical protein